MLKSLTPFQLVRRFLPSSPSFGVFSTLLVRPLHNPASVRGVGPRPRTSAFYNKTHFKRRLIEQRAKLWNQHVNNARPLSSRVNSTYQDTITMPVWSIQQQAQTGSVVNLSSYVFCNGYRPDLIARVVDWQRACRRQGSHKTLGRSEVWGSGKKVRPQKGSGRARMADPHAPHHFGGGWAFPRRPAKYAYPLPRSTIMSGKRAALTAKYLEGNLFIIEQPVLRHYKTSYFLHCMRALRWGTFTCVHAEGELDTNMALAARNIQQFKFLSVEHLNVYDIVAAQRVLITTRALQQIEQRLNPTAQHNNKQLRFLVGTYGGGYTRDQVEIIKPGSVASAGSTLVPHVSIDGAQLYIKADTPQPYATPVFWP